MIAALYVDPNGVYSGLPDVEVWDEARDARTYAGPWLVVAHPPCARWGSLAFVNQPARGFGDAAPHSATCCSTWPAPPSRPQRETRP